MSKATMRRISLLVLISACSGFTGGLLATFYGLAPLDLVVPDTLKAKRVQIIDDRGGVAAELSALGLNLLGQDGRVRVTLRLQYNDNGVLAFSEGRLLFGFLGDDTLSEKVDDWGLQIYGPDHRRTVVSLAATGNRTNGHLALAAKRENVYLVCPHIKHSRRLRAHEHEALYGD